MVTAAQKHGDGSERGRHKCDDADEPAIATLDAPA
jgi:hypothetical protein